MNEAALARRRAELELAHAEGVSETEIALRRAQAEAALSEARARVITAEKLPELAGAVGQRFGEVKLTEIGGDAPFATIAQAVASVVELAKAV